MTSGLGGGWGGPARLPCSAAAPGQPPCRYAAASAATSLHSPSQAGKARRGRSAPRPRGALSLGSIPLCGGRPGGLRIRGMFHLQEKLAAGPSTACWGRLGCLSQAAARRCREEV